MATAFLLTPFSPESAGGESEDVFVKVQDSIREAASRLELDLLQADDIFASGVVIDQIRGAIQRADIVVAVCTGRNANVFYELGYAHAHGHEPVLVAATTDDLPFDVRHRRAQLYAGGSIESLADRLEHTLRETLADAWDPTVALPEAAALTQDQLAGPLELVRADDRIGFLEGFKALVTNIGESVGSISDANWETRPSDNTLDDLKAIRYESAEALVAWLGPAIEYESDWLAEALRLLGPWFLRRPDRSGGFDFWRHANEPWVLLTLKTTLAFSLVHRSPSATAAVLGVELVTDQETGPLVLHPEASWALGYFGDADIAFKDLDAFIGQSVSVTAARELAGLESLEVSCGADLTIGIARCLLEDGADDGTYPTSSAPQAYAAFARYYCTRIQWIGRLLSSNDDLARAVGAASGTELAGVAAEWYPKLVGNRVGMLKTCSSWDQASA